MKYFVLTILFLLISTHAAVRAVLDRDTIMVGETIGLRIIADNARLERIEAFPNIPGLTFGGGGDSQQYSNINGETSLTFTRSFSVIASKEGEFTIPSMKVTAGGRQYTTTPLKLRVTKASAEAGNQLAFSRLVVSKTNVYVGEVFPIEIQLYVTEAQQLQLPTLNSDGFIVQKQSPYTRSTAQRGNIVYNVLTFRSAVAAAKAGELDLGPAEMSFDLILRQSRDPFENFLRGGERHPTTVKTDSFKMQVMPLPRTNAPPGFSGAIGTFAMNVDASPLTVNAGDPITLKLTVSGRGNLESIQMPKFNWPGFKFYEPQSTVTSNDPLGMEGSKDFEQVIIPESAEVKEIPTVEFSFFDPAQQKYKTLTRTSVPLQVRPGAAGAAVPPAPQNAKTAAEDSSVRDIVHIKSDPGAMLAVAPPLIARPWFLGLQAIPLAALLSAFVYRKRADKLVKNPRLRRKLEARKFIGERLPELERLAASQRTDDFYALVFRLLQEQLGERLNLPSSAITEAVLDQELPRRNAPAKLIEELHHLFQECNQARYAPGGPGGHLQGLVPRVRQALQELQSLPD